MSAIQIKVSLVEDNLPLATELQKWIASTKGLGCVGVYPTAEEARITVAIVHAARVVRDLNFRYLAEGHGTPVTARFDANGITIVDPLRAIQGKDFEKIYTRPL